MIPTPDLLDIEPRVDVDQEQLLELFGLAFAGRGDAPGINAALVRSADSDTGWTAESFAPDLFLRELIQEGFAVRHDGNVYTPNRKYLFRVASRPPATLEGTRFRQAILQELWTDGDLYAKALELYVRLYDMINMLKIPGQSARLDLNAFRLDLFRLVRDCVDGMTLDFEAASSGLRRIHEAGQAIQQSEIYATLAALIDYADQRAVLNVDIRVGAGGRITHLSIQEIRQSEGNRFFLSPLQRWLTKAKALLWYGFQLGDEEMLNRLIQSVYDQAVIPMMALGQLLGQLEVYLTQHQFRQKAEAAGLPMCLAEVSDGNPLVLDRLYNPLLLTQLPEAPVPASLSHAQAPGITLLTGPNSGGKTRLLQSLGLAQLFGQGGFYVSAERASLIPVRGLFVSVVEAGAADHREGRMGQELERIRTMFTQMKSPSMIIIDELGSGTNPSEGTEIFSLVLRLLEKAQSVAFITTHFLDYARALEADPPVHNLRYLQVEVDDEQQSTYQFVPGVASTSLAAVIAERMGVTFDAISEALDRSNNEG